MIHNTYIYTNTSPFESSYNETLLLPTPSGSLTFDGSVPRFQHADGRDLAGHKEHGKAEEREDGSFARQASLSF